MSGAGGPVVLQVTPNLGIGGAQENVVTMSTHLPRAGCPTVVCSFADGPLRADIERLGVTVEILPAREHSVVALPAFVAEMVRRRRDLIKIIERHGVEVVQTRGLGTLGFLVMTVRRHARVWWTLENVTFMVREEHQLDHRWLFRPKRAAHRLLYRTGAGIVNGIIVVSEETERSFRDAVGYRGRKVRVVPNGVDLERYPAAIERDRVRGELGFGPNDHVMTMVGTFKRQKGHRYLIEAADRVLRNDPGLHLVLVGDGELSERIRAQARGAGLQDRIHFLGTRRDVPAILAASDSFVLPSLWEGLSVALVEAMASRLPVIATDVSGTNRVMVNGVTGWVVPPGDADALAAAMTDLRADPDRAASMAEAARSRVADHFSAERQAEQLATLFRANGAVRDASSIRLGTEVR